MTDNSEDSDVFEITDFTTASDWERFTSRLEETVHEWKLTSVAAYEPLTRAEYCNGVWKEVSEEIAFVDFPFIVTHYGLTRAKDGSGVQTDHSISTNEGKDDLPAVLLDLMSMDNDFPSKAHCLARWYGLRSFVVLCPKAYAVTNVSRVNTLISTIALAINNSGCQVPIFVQLHEKWRRLYVGHFETQGIRTTFEMVHLKQMPDKYCHLSGLLDVFKGKLNSAMYPAPHVNAVIRLTYVLSEWPDEDWTEQHSLQLASGVSDEPQSVSSEFSSLSPMSDLLELPFGACEDPISELHLAATWPNMSEDAITESDIYSDLDPLQAPLWTVRVKMVDDPQCLLSQYLQEFCKLCSSDESVEQVLGLLSTSAEEEPSINISSALERLTEPSVNIHMPSTIHKVVSSTTSRLQKKDVNFPIPDCQLNQILEHLFPDPKRVDREALSPRPTLDNCAFENKDPFSQYKTAPVDSLLYKLAICICVVNYSFGGVKAVAHLWQEVILEMRYRWERGHLILGLERGSPNLRFGILYQKLQMLNCCIEKKIARERSAECQQVARVIAKSQKQGGTESQHGGATVPCGGGSSVAACPQLDSAASVAVDSASGTDLSSSPLPIFTADEVAVTDDTTGSSETVEAMLSASPKADDDSDEFFECEDVRDAAAVDGDSRGDGDATSSRPMTQTEVIRVPSSSATINAQQPGQVEISKPKVSTSGGALSSCSDDRSTLEAEVRNSEDGSGDSATYTPQGRLRRCGDLTLIDFPSEPLYIPVTQEPAPMTEDMLAEHAEVLTKLGTSAEGASLRARMQSASLLSDMESFKAANPGCSLEDFVRWYSPRDFVTVDKEQATQGAGVADKVGHLSERMLVPGNMWVEVWQSAKAVPARMQRRLFDDTKEAEKVLHYLSSLKPGMVALHLLPLIIQAAIIRLKKEDDSAMASVQALVEATTSKTGSLSRHMEQTAALYADVIRQIRLAETAMARAQSLHTKLPTALTATSSKLRHGNADVTDCLRTFVRSLLEQPEVDIADGARGPVGAAVASLFTSNKHEWNSHQGSGNGPSQQRQPEGQGHGRGTAAAGGYEKEKQDFPPPAAKEYILRSVAACPAPYSRPYPQRLYCTMLPNEVRLAGAFTHDTTFQ